MQTRARQGRFCVLRLSEQLKNPMKLGQKSGKNLVSFLVDLKTPKIHSDINLPLYRIYVSPLNQRPAKKIIPLGMEICNSKIWPCRHQLETPKSY